MAWLYSDQWAAGFFDGEGNVSIFRRQRGNCLEYRVVLQITQKDSTPLLHIQEEFGGSISHASNPADCFRWRADGEAVDLFLKRVGPYLLVKRQEALVAAEMRLTTGQAGHRLPEGTSKKRADIYERFRALK
jgi:hypothetical protein